MHASPEPRQLSEPGIVPALWGVLEIPQEPVPCPGVILLPGSSGWKPVYSELAKALAASGFVALALDYLAETGRDPSNESVVRYRPVWQAIVRNAVALLHASPFVSGCPIGLVGYSLGAGLAISVASTLPGVGAVVEFFGGGSRDAAKLQAQLEHFPPLLILHGDADSVVPIDRGHRLRDAAIAQGCVVEMHIYPGAGHGFNAPWSPWYSAPEANDSLTRTIDFLTRRLADGKSHRAGTIPEKQ